MSHVGEETKKRLRTQTSLDQEKTFQKREWGASWREQYLILFMRGIKERRHDYFSWLRITQVLVTAVILGLLWWQSAVHSPKELDNQVRVLSF